MLEVSPVTIKMLSVAVFFQLYIENSRVFVYCVNAKILLASLWGTESCL